MKILLAPDKFKGSLSAQAACEAIGSGLQQNNATTITTVFHPMADGGDGSLQSIASHLDLTKQSVQTSDPLGRPISTTYLTSSKAAFIEVASSSGLMLLDK
ncbi:MAG: glycerate kinase, partial [Chitinophagales bacterium]